MPALKRISGHALFGLALTAGMAWTATALSVQLDGLPLQTALAALGAGGLVALVLRRHARRLGWAALLLGAALTAGWYSTIRPSQTREWRFDVAHGAAATVNGDVVTIANLRNFVWQDSETATQRWETRQYDLRQLETVDMLTSVWDSPDIAHLLVSFGFANGDHLVWSVEIRKETDEQFSTVGGFFRQFERVLIAATEEDIVKLRTNIRHEDVRLYPVNLNAAQRRALFLSYVDLAQGLTAHPDFYNTITANCTTSVYRLARVLKDDLPIDSRLIMSGNLPEYLDDLHVLKGDMTMTDRRASAAITAKAQAADPAIPFSVAIRM